MDCFLGGNAKNAIFKEIKNLLPFKVTEPEPEDWSICDTLAVITWSWLFSFCFITFLTFEQCQGYIQDHRSMMEQMQATLAVSFVLEVYSNVLVLSVQSKGSIGTGDPRVLGLLKTSICYKTGVRWEVGWKCTRGHTYFSYHSYSRQILFLSCN